MISDARTYRMRGLSFEPAFGACMLPALSAAGTMIEPLNRGSRRPVGYVCTSSNEEMPTELDGVVAAPGCHRVMYEEGGIRVLEVTVEAGEREPIHTHEYGAILIGLVEARLLYEIFAWEDGAWVQTSAEERTTTPFAARWVSSEPPHALTSLDDVTFKAIRVEFLDPTLADFVGRMQLDPEALGATILSRIGLDC